MSAKPLDYHSVVISGVSIYIRFNKYGKRFPIKSRVIEDIYFSEKVREAGFDLWVDPAVQCHHFHTIDILEVFMIAMQAKKMGYQQAKAEIKAIV